jgi:hypothetical protein
MEVDIPVFYDIGELIYLDWKCSEVKDVGCVGGECRLTGGSVKRQYVAEIYI